MNQQGNPKTRRALAIAIALNGVLAVALLYVWWHSHHATASHPATPDSSQMTVESDGNSNSSRGEAAASSEPSLAPVQLTPQRLQSIGVKTGLAEAKPVEDEVRTVPVTSKSMRPGWLTFRPVFPDGSGRCLPTPLTNTSGKASPSSPSTVPIWSPPSRSITRQAEPQHPHTAR